ncbi:MAG TPA: NAD(P)/FAD-dependent oxidoreductase [Galbitalea sp.]
MPDVFDVAIVGGGPVGLAAAIEARLAGLSVVLAEPRSGTIDKACGEGLMPGALPILHRLGVDPAGMPIMGITYNQGKQSVTHRFEGSPGRGVRRTTLHAALTERALDAGVEFIAAKVERLEQTADVAVLNGSIRARYVLACDGLHSTLAKLAGLALPAPKRGRRYGLRQHYAMKPWGDTVEIYYGPRAEIYVTPIAPDTVGIAMLGRQHTNFNEAIGAVATLAERTHGVAVTSSLRGAGPFRQRTRARTSGRVLLVGDASGYVDAITGEGLRLGFAQAAAAVECVLAGRPHDYEQRWTSLTRDFRVTTTTLVRFATSPLRRGIVPLSAALPGAFGAVVESLAR